jgi:serine/threonine protein kinase
MTPERWREVTQIYGAVVSQAPERRAAAVAELCGADEDLRREIESLLQSKDSASLLERAAADRGSVMQMLTIGSQIGVFRIDSLLGVGGMGEVYRAHDSKLNRAVAIKILPPAFASDPDRLARFKREAQVLASLNHPNVGGIYGFEDANGIRALVLELVDGPTLAERLQASGSGLPLEEALGIARQIADALEAAHEQSIIHRDLKPANIKVRDDGTVKVLDFGLAKIAEAAGEAGRAGGAGLNTQSPTITTPAMTQAGMILGTAAYMSPEQAKGRPADKRSDIWAFGCVFYEMLTGKRAFDGEDVSETLANVLKSEPAWQALPASTPEAIRRLLQRCLQKDRKRRLSDIADARLELDEGATAPDWTRNPVARSMPLRPMGWAIAALLVAAAGVGGMLAARSVFDPKSPDLERRLELATPPTSDPLSLAVSPNGRKVVFAASENGRTRLWVRSLDSFDAKPLPGTDAGYLPFWSPDSQFIGFFTDEKLKRIDTVSGSVQAIADVRSGQGGNWNGDGWILFSASSAGQIFRVKADGTQRTPVTHLAKEEQGHRFPQLLADGQHILYFVRGDPAIRGIYVSRLDGSQAQRILDGETSGPVYASKGQLFFVRQNTLFSQAFDLDRLALTGTPSAISDRVPSDAQYRAGLSVSAAGPIVFRAGSASDVRQFIWFDRTGKELGKLGDPDPGRPLSPSMSPDGKQIAVHRSVDGNVDIWLMDTTRGFQSRLTTAATNEIYPLWFPDGKRIAYGSLRNGIYDLFEKGLTPDSPEHSLLVGPDSKQAEDFSSDGRFLLYGTSAGSAFGRDQWAIPLDGDRTPFPVAKTQFNERDGRFSPDSHWVAYESNESGTSEIYVQSFPRADRKTRVSTSGGSQPRWSHDGNELYYIALDDRLMAVPFTTKDGEPIPRIPIPLFRTRVGGAQQVSTGPMYMVAPDGRFLMDTVVSDEASSVEVILNLPQRTK